MPRAEQSSAHSPKAVQLKANGEKSKLISIRVETEVLHRLQALAREKQKGYQTLLKQFVIERLAEEEQKFISE